MNNDLDERRRIDNIRHEKPGRPRGIANLSPKVKAEIVAHKNLHLLSHPSIAAKFNVSRQTVQVTTEESLKPEAKKHLHNFVQTLSDIREETAALILEKVQNKSIKDGVLPSLLNIANQNYRLETNQSTQNIAVSNHAQILHNWISTNQPNPTEIDQAIEATSDNNGYSAQELRDCLANIAGLETTSQID